MKFWPFRFRQQDDLQTPVDPVFTDDEIEFYRDMRRLRSLADEVLDDTRLARIEISDDIYVDYVARPLHEMVCRPVETEWDWYWPDHAAVLLTLWKMDREMARLAEEMV